MPVTNVKIFPAIGVARLGNSPGGFFIGPEIPGVHAQPSGGYKDNSCRMKRQAARFRLFGYDGNTLVKELTLDEADVSALTWTVHIANKKASWKQFAGPNPNAPLRNPTVADRSSLEIDPGPRTLNGPNQAAGFNTGQFLGKFVPLGEMRTDAQGRLLVLGGAGNSGSVPAGLGIGHYANNDGWHDDVSDGPVTATVTVNGTTFTASPSWVLCAPPDFAPALESVTTLYDVLFQTALDKGLPGVAVPATPSLSSDVFPILRRVFQMMRLNQGAASGHFDFDNPSTMSAARRLSIFNHVRDPNNPGANDPNAAANMPKLFDDTNQYRHVVTKTQYEILEKWKNGTFTNDWPPLPPSSSITPEGLTRAALEACVGAAFFPGIEASWFLRDTYNYSEPFRLDHTGRSAGDVSKQMAVPWQADFWKCQKVGSVGWWPAQRPDDVYPEGGGANAAWTRQIISNHEDMVGHWQKLGVVVEKGGAFVETERHKVCRNIFMITDRSTFSKDEVDGVLSAGAPAQFNDALYVIAEGLAVSELGLSSYSPSNADLQSQAPSIVIRRANNSVVSGMSAPVQGVLFENTSLPLSARQRVTFVYRVEFQDSSAFVAESETVAATATKDSFTATGSLTLLKQPNPYMLDGPTHWLSTDVRVFQITEGQSRFGLNMGNNAAAATSFISSVVNAFRAHGAANHPYDTISTDQQASKLELSEKVGTQRVFNFAVARVRYRGKLLDAQDVRVFFRLFTTAATGLAFNENETYRRTASGTPISLLGLQAGHVVTIPCYGNARVNSASAKLTTQTDTLNVDTLVHGGADEVQSYFGCWLDFNQTAPQFPSTVAAGQEDGPWGSGRKSIQELIRGLHQCLVAEVYFDKDPIPGGAAPAASDNLAQRNLAIVESDNPGSPATHTVQHTFEIQASRFDPQVARLQAQLLAAARNQGEFEESGTARAAVLPLPGGGRDELMIRWNNLPRETRATLYMPDVDVDDVLKYAGQNYEAANLERVDDHTLGLQFGDVTYVPLPAGRRRNIAALLTLELPEALERGQLFNLVVHQISGRTRSILGAFQFTIPVSAKSLLLEPEMRSLSVLRHIAQAIPVDDSWHPVFVRYLDQIADRVRGFGGDPDSIAPSPDGRGAEGEPVDEATKRCARLGWLYSVLLALFVIAAAWHPMESFLPEVVVAIGAAAAAAVWRRRCGPSRCRVITASVLGLALGAAGAAVLALAGLSGTLVLAAAALAIAILIAAGMRLGCFMPAGKKTS